MPCQYSDLIIAIARRWGAWRRLAVTKKFLPLNKYFSRKFITERRVSIDFSKTFQVEPIGEEREVVNRTTVEERKENVVEVIREVKTR